LSIQYGACVALSASNIVTTTATRTTVTAKKYTEVS
jgi:hypothetical protein